jgi:chromosome segregation ATPase
MTKLFKRIIKMLSDLIQKIRDALAPINADINALKDQNVHLVGALADAQGQITTLSAEISNATTQLNDLLAQVATLTTLPTADPAPADGSGSGDATP